MTGCCNNGLLLLLVLAVTCLDTASAQCVRGEPKQGEPEPDLNMTVLPSTLVQQGDKIVISCIAGKPRFPAREERPIPPNRVVVFQSQNPPIQTCRINAPTNDPIRCNGTLRITNTTMATVRCVAISDSGCRSKMLNLTFRKGNAPSMSLTMSSHVMQSSSKDILASTTAPTAAFSTTGIFIYGTSTSPAVRPSSALEGTTTPTSRATWTTIHLNNSIIICVSFILWLLNES